MADPEHLAILEQGAEAWNQWRETDPDLRPQLSDAALSGRELRHINLHRATLAGAHLNHADLRGANLSRANLSGSSLQLSCLAGAQLVQSDLSGANLFRTDLCGADLTASDLRNAYMNGANLSGANVSGADLSKSNLFEATLDGARLVASKLRWANLTGASLSKADLRRADLSGVSLIEANAAEADLTSANLRYAHVIDTNLEKAQIVNCRVYGISAWNLALDQTIQSNLIIARPDEPTITVDDLEVAQFIHQLLNSQRVRHVIDTITSKVVLVLGRFTPERKTVLDAIRDHLRQRNLLPILFDFDRPVSRDITETLSTLAHMARFVIADITDARSVPQELMAIVPNLPSVPVQPLLWACQQEYGMFEHFKRYPWVLEPFLYADLPSLLVSLNEKVIGPAEARARVQTKR